MLKNVHEVDGWLIEEPTTTTCVQRYCKRCRKDQPVENFMRVVSDKQALFLARREGMSDTTAELYERASVHKTSTTIAHKMCNECAVKLRKNKVETADEYDRRLRLMKRYEFHVANPDYITDIATPNVPPTITERELKVRKYKAEHGLRRAAGKRKAEKAKHAPKYTELLKEVRNETARIKMMQNAPWLSYAEDAADFLSKYLDHIETIRTAIRADKFAPHPIEPRANAFKYINYDNARTKAAMYALHNMPEHDLDKVQPRLIPTAELVNEREADKQRDFNERWGDAW